MKKSLVFSAAFPDTVNNFDLFIERLEYVSRDNFYDTIEFFFKGTKEERNSIREALDHYNFSSIYLGAFHLKQNEVNLGNLNKPARERAIAEAKLLIDYACEFGSEKIMVVSGTSLLSNMDKEQSFTYLVDSLITLCKYSEEQSKKKNMEKPLIITLEFFNNEGEPFLLLGPTSHSAKLAEIVRKSCSNFELTFDISHIYQLKEDPMKSFNLANSYVNHIHLANCVTQDQNHPLFGDKHPPFSLPEGEVSQEEIVDFMKFLRRVKKMENLTIGVEVIPDSKGMEEDVYKECTEFFEKTINLLKVY